MPASSPIPIYRLQVDQVLRDARPKTASEPIQDGFVNFYAATAMPGGKLVGFDAGINRMARVASPDGPRRPAIVISSSPHKSGSVVTPWEDEFAPDDGYVRYFGDAKTPGRAAHLAPGNALLLEQYGEHHSHSAEANRRAAVPLVFFQRRPHAGVQKGFPRFQGFGLLTGVRLITQYSAASGGAFANYEFECAVLSMSGEGELFDWSWINARRDEAVTDTAALKQAPRSWQRWVKEGEGSIPRVRRKVLRRKITPVTDQIPMPGSQEAELLQKVYSHYAGKKVYFESLAAAIAERVVASAGASYTTHGVTRGSGDAGIDFIGQLDVGEGFSRAPLVVLGQAKCVAPGSTTNARDLARTVARLRRGWLGVFVTTGAISEKAQLEVYEDRYPLVMIAGAQVAATVRQLLHEQGNVELAALLARYDREYEATPRVSDPERLVV